MRVLTILAAAALAACASQAGADGPLVISKQVADGFDAYKAWLTPIGKGAFAVSRDGKSFASWGCPSGACYVGPSSVSEAVKACEARSAGSPCDLFARNREVVVPYEVAQ